MGKPRLKKPLSREEMEKLTTPRLLAYRKRLYSAPEGPSYDERKPGDTHYGLYKSHDDWKAAAANLKAVLAGRENIE